MLDVHAPIHMMRKSRYSNALKTRVSKWLPLLGEGLSTGYQVQDVAIAIIKKDEPIALILHGFTQEMDPLRQQLLVSFIEVVRLNR